MKITIFEVEATAEDLKASRTPAEVLSMAVERMLNVFCGTVDTIMPEEGCEDPESDSCTE